MSPARVVEWLTLVPAIVRLLSECKNDTPDERRIAADDRVLCAARRVHQKRLASKGK